MSNKRKNLVGKLFKVNDDVSEILILYPGIYTGAVFEDSYGIVIKNPQEVTGMYQCMINKKIVMLFDNEIEII